MGPPSQVIAATHTVKEAVEKIRENRSASVNKPTQAPVQASREEYAGRLINHVLNNPDEFQRLIPNYFDFGHAIFAFPEYEEEMINPILNDPVEFSCIINSENYYHLKYTFPTYLREVAVTSTIEQALRKITQKECYIKILDIESFK